MVKYFPKFITMDIDGASFSGEIDQNLLLQFSCMNTTDREELISQMQKLLGNSVNYNTASFFLDMSNWNLQTAICCYLDYTLPAKLPSMSLKGAQCPSTPVAPGSGFEQNWNLANTGAEQWPGSCRLVQIGGEPLGASPMYVPPLPSGHTTTVTLQLTAPSAPGFYRSYFHLVTDKGDKIGDTLWVEITVESDTTMALAEQLAALPVPSSRLDESVAQVHHNGLIKNKETFEYTAADDAIAFTTLEEERVPSQDDQMC